MSILIFKLRNVPEDEKLDIVQLLEKSHIEHYETDAGNWGISMPGLWLKDPDDTNRAKTLIEQYQNERAIQARSDYHQQRQSGNHRTLIDVIKDRPLPSLGLLLFCLFILYVSIQPFVDLAQR